MRTARLLALAFLTAAPLAGQMTAAEHIAVGDSLRRELRSAEALRHYQMALELQPTSYVANWKAAREIADVAKQLLGNADSIKDRRDSLFTLGRSYAETAIRIDSTNAEGHFTLALNVGRLARTKGGKAKVRLGKIVYDEASRAIQLDSLHDGAYHILGMWNDEVMNLSGFMKFFAKALFGGGFLSNASWDHARANMERAVALRPNHVYHNLELATVYLDIGETALATQHLQQAESLPIGDPMDPHYKQLATAALAAVRANKIGDAKDILHKG